jgi:glycosyltransferase involved in cell wall biosynthesis
MTKIKSKPRVALFAAGVIGGGNIGYGIPVLRDLFVRLSADYNIILYSFSEKDESKTASGIRVRRISWKLPQKLKFLMLCSLFITDHFFNRFSLIFAVSVSPAGHWAVRMRRLFEVPVVVQLIGFEAAALPDIGYGGLLKPQLREITTRVCTKSDVLVVLAEYQRQIARKSLNSGREMELLPVRVDCNKFVYRKRWITFPIQFLHIGYYSKIKDQDTMFSAFAIVSQVIDSRLTVIGDGYGIPKVSGLIKQLGIEGKVTFIGEIPESQIAAHFDDKHFLIHTSRFEAGCAVIQEAMASGVAVCSTDVGFISDLGDAYAVTVPVGNYEELAKKILQLAHDHEAYDRLTSKAYDWIRKHDLGWSVTAYDMMLKKLLHLPKIQ